MPPWIGKRAPAKPKLVAEDDPRLTVEYCRAHRNFYVRNCLKIATKNTGLQPLFINHTQQRILDAIDDARARGIPPRIIVLKSRQVGVSTLSEALLFSDALFHPNRGGLVLAHTKPAAKNLLRMTKRFYRYLPKALRIGAKLENVNELELDNESRVQVEAVGEVRSYTAQSVHFSELAFYEKATDVLVAVMQSVPASTNSLAIIESTANGVGNKFHEMWVNAINGEANTELADWERGWTPVFIPWFKHEEYKLKPWFDASELTTEERKLARAHSLELEQLAWRRWCIRLNMDGDVDAFRVEYPSTWQEAFALSGRPVFDHEGLEHYRATVPLIAGRDVASPRADGPQFLYHAELARPCEISFDKSTSKPALDHVEGGRLRIYVAPHPRHTYIIGADPSEGDPKSDPSPLQVLDQMTLEFVAEWWGRTPPDLLAEYSAWLGYHYGNALIVGEANNHGISFHGRLLDLEYPNLYFRTASEETVAGQVTDKPGWWETNKAKHLLIDTFRKYVREKRGGIYSPGLVGEMSTTIYERKEGFTVTKITKQPGHFIDRVIAAGMALALHRGTVTAPLLPLPELEMARIDEQVRLLRERDPEGATKLSLDLTGMTEAELSRTLQARLERRMHNESMGMGGER